MKQPLYKVLSLALNQIACCEATGNREWRDKARDRVRALVENHMPSGSGFDTGTHLDLVSTEEKLVFTTSFHHMTEGSYDGWTDHQITVTPSLGFDFHLKISGKNRNDIKDYIHEVFHWALQTEVE